MREAAYALEIKRAERQQKLTEQHAREQKNNVYVTKRAQENMDVREAAFIVAASLAGIRSKKATTDRIEDLYGSLSTDMKEKILRAVMGGDVG